MGHMQSPVSYERREGVALITLDKPPVNGLGAALRKSLLDAGVLGRAAT